MKTKISLKINCLLFYKPTHSIERKLDKSNFYHGTVKQTVLTQRCLSTLRVGLLVKLAIM